MLIIKPGLELIHKESNVLYIIKSVKQENIILVSEDGKAGMFLHQDSIALSGFEPVSDWAWWSIPCWGQYQWRAGESVRQTSWSPGFRRNESSSLKEWSSKLIQWYNPSCRNRWNYLSRTNRSLRQSSPLLFHPIFSSKNPTQNRYTNGVLSKNTIRSTKSPSPAPNAISLTVVTDG